MLFQDHSESLEYRFEVILDRYDTISSRSRSLGYYFESSWIARILFQVIRNRWDIISSYSRSLGYYFQLSLIGRILFQGHSWLPGDIQDHTTRRMLFQGRLRSE